MNTEYLHYFELAYRERNYSAAARLVPCSPQGLAKAIHALEKELGVALFDADPETGMPIPTDYAHELFEFAAVYNSNERLLRESFDRIRGQERRVIRLACSLGILGVFGPDFMPGFAARYPQVSVEHWESNDELCDRSLLSGDADLALALAPYPAGVHVSELYRAPVYYWVNVENPLAQRASLRPEDFAGQDIAIPGTGFKCLGRLRREAAEAGVSLGTVYEMSEIFQLYEFAASGQGLGFTVRHLVNLPTFSRLDSVVALPLEGEPWRFGIARLETHALGDAERAFWDWCATSARSLPRDETA